jgi:hypothetical protein
VKRRWSQALHLHIVARQVVAGGKSGLLEEHRAIGRGQKFITEANFNLGVAWSDGNGVTRLHDPFNGMSASGYSSASGIHESIGRSYPLQTPWSRHSARQPVGMISTRSLRPQSGQ